MKALLGWLLVFALFFGLWFSLAPVREENNKCRDAGGQPWPTGCFKTIDPSRIDITTGKE